MIETKHTPGPWQLAGARHSGDLQIGPDTRLLMVGPDEDAVAAVFFDMKTGRGHNDAQLIAAAPDLLKALDDSLALLLLHTGADDDIANLVINNGRAAIAKAKGDPS
jgi:hypothetical protein